jgi:drug/metabolite transporter (DMT)-like permease
MMDGSSLEAERIPRPRPRTLLTGTGTISIALLVLILIVQLHIPATAAFQNPYPYPCRHSAKAKNTRPSKSSAAGNRPCFLGPTTRSIRLGLVKNDDDQSLVDSPAAASIAAAAERQKGLLVLLTVPFCWGTFEPAVRYVYAMDPPINSFVFSLAYYAVASVSLLIAASLATRPSPPPSPQDIIDNDDDDDDDDEESIFGWPIQLQGGLELGTYLFVGNALQVLGLKTVPADRAAFLLQLTTLFVPVLDAVFQRSIKAVSTRTWIACVVALAGVSVMGLDDGGIGGGGDSDSVSVNVSSEWLSPQRFMDVFSHVSSGDALIVAAALAYSFHCLRLGGYAKQMSAVQLAASKASVETFLAALLVVGLVLFSQNTATDSSSGQAASEGLAVFLESSGQDITTFLGSLGDYLSLPSSVWIPAVAAILWTGWVTVAYTIYAQSYGQRRVQPVTANLIYTFQPVCTAIIAWALLGESLGPAGYFGGALIGSAALIVVVPEE